MSSRAPDDSPFCHQPKCAYALDQQWASSAHGQQPDRRRLLQVSYQTARTEPPHSTPTAPPIPKLELLSQARPGGPDVVVMFGTKMLLNPLNSLFAKVHHLSPLTQRESQRLLKALTSSFRKSLDQEHGSWDSDAHPPSHTSAPSSTVSKPASPNEPHRHPTDRHVRAILSNPLFSYGPTKRAQTPARDRDPMDIFDEAVAKGLMTPTRAAGVLAAKRNALIQSSILCATDSAVNSGAALRVVQWLRSSGLERDLSFLGCKTLVHHLVPLMVQEHLEEVAWIWLDRSVHQMGHAVSLSSGDNLQPASHLLKTLVKTKAPPTGSLDGSYASMIRAGDMFHEEQNFAPTAIDAWRTLSKWSTVEAWQRTRPSEALFDSFAELSRYLATPRRDWSVHLERAHLDLHHPTHPDSTRALHYLKTSPQIDHLCRLINQEKSQDHQVPANRTAHQSLHTILDRVVLMARDAAQHLVRVGQQAEAENIQTLVTDKFGVCHGDFPGAYRGSFHTG